MNILRVCIVFFAFAVIAARAEETNTPTPASATNNTALTSVTSNALPVSITIDGTTYENVRWGRLTPSTVTIFHRTGIATMPLWKLPPDLQRQFNYDPQKAADWQKRIAAAEREARARAVSNQMAQADCSYTVVGTLLTKHWYGWLLREESWSDKTGTHSPEFDYGILYVAAAASDLATGDRVTFHASSDGQGVEDLGSGVSVHVDKWIWCAP